MGLGVSYVPPITLRLQELLGRVGFELWRNAFASREGQAFRTTLAAEYSHLSAVRVRMLRFCRDCAPFV